MLGASEAALSLGMNACTIVEENKPENNQCYSPNRACTDGVLALLSQLLGSPQLLWSRAAAEGAPAISAPGPAQAWKKADFWKSGDLGIQKFGIPKLINLTILKIQIRSAQNVGKVWVTRNKSSWPPLGPSQAIFCMDRKKSKKCQKMSIFLGGPMGPIHPVWGCWHQVIC